MRSRRPAVRVHPTPPIGPTDRPKDSNQRVRLTESQTRRETPHPSSLAYEVALLGYDRAIRHRKSCVRGPQGLQIDRGEIVEIFLPSEIVGS
jgi:hypothetical protein